MLFERILYSLKEFAQRNAFCIDDKYYTYNDINSFICSVKEKLNFNNEKIKSKKVAIVCNNDVFTYSSLMSIWFSGYAYVPLGLHNPVERNLAILKEAKVDVIISSSKLDDDRYSEFTVINPVSDASTNVQLVKPDINPGDLAYILFTSGSTGLPKGVPISHKNLTTFVKSFEASEFKITKSDRCLQMFELTFDVSVSSFLIPFLNGACIYTVSNQGIKYINVLKLIQQYQLTSIQIVPSIIRLGKSLLPRLKFPEVKNCILTGEATHIDLLPEWQKSLPNAQLFNFYGPTESTIYCSSYKCDLENMKEYNGMLAIGKPLQNVTLLVVNEDFKETNVNEKGELLIGGDQVTEGYLNNELKNRESFISVNRNGRVEIFYRSGDMCYRDLEGDIFYCGRYDNQVKIQGFRVELSEIEICVRSQFGINNIVIPFKNRLGAVELELVVEKNLNGEYATILNHLKSRLPEYMIPVRVSEMNEFPVNSSGKTDRNNIKAQLDARRQ